jgi:transcription initiation factor TFIIIB Brf1 subunit/transcription initiation factor TFIIB
MDYFSLLEEHIADEEHDDDEDEPEDGACSHSSLSEQRGMFVCIQCGCVMPDNYDNDKEYKYINMKQQSGRQVRKMYEKSIFKDLDAYCIPQNIQIYANEHYKKVSDGKIFRGQSRKAVIFSCVFIAYKQMNQPQSIERLQTVFKINKKTVSKGIKIVGLALQKQDNKMFLNVDDIIPEMLSKFQSSTEVQEKVKQLYYMIQNRSSTINRSRPRSVAAALIYYFMKASNKQFSDKIFCSTVQLSKLTIQKLHQEIAACIQSQIHEDTMRTIIPTYQPVDVS